MLATLLRPVLLAALALTLAGRPGHAAGAAAQEPADPPPPIAFPQFDKAAYCFYAGVNTSGVYDRAKCFEDEDRSAAQVAQQWSRLPREVQITCGHIARETGRSYFILKACLRNLARSAWTDLDDYAEVLDRSQQIARGFRR